MLRICKGSNTWYQSSILGDPLPFHNHSKQFPQLLRSLPTSTVISTIADHPLISS
ncbi:hypothetical protein BHM03_00005324 [Ensete ventricosum]|nr:hypothetical protein BHM03_00005324 [Ensete ventricosum]